MAGAGKTTVGHAYERYAAVFGEVGQAEGFCLVSVPDVAHAVSTRFEGVQPELSGTSAEYTPRGEGLQLASRYEKALPGEPGRALNTLVS